MLKVKLLTELNDSMIEVLCNNKLLILSSFGEEH